MKTRQLIFSAAALIALFVPSAFAQSSTSSSGASSTSSANPPSIQQRKDNQQDRIAQGIQSGQLTAGETKNLETKEAGLNSEERGMRAADNGHLTAGDRSVLNKQQNHLSNQIYSDKHNANVAHYGSGTIGQRQQNQQNRIAQGVKSGHLTAGQTAKLEGQQQGINHQVAGMRAANGGKLTAGDKSVINKQQNAASRNIYAQKHSAAHTQK